MFKKFVEGKTAAFFDLDGTIIDSLPYWDRAFREILPNLTDEHISLHDLRWGTHVAEIWRNILREHKIRTDLKIDALVEKTNQSYLKIFREEPLEARDGFWNLIYELKTDKNYKLALISNSDRVVVDEILGILNLKEDIFDLTISGDEVKHRKPAADIYLTAMKKLGLNSNEVLVFEDSVSGATSASKAGLDMIIIWSGEIREPDYPKKVFTFIPDFTSLPGNLDQFYFESLKEQVDNL